MDPINAVLFVLLFIINNTRASALQGQDGPVIGESGAHGFQDALLGEVLNVCAPTSDSFQNDLCRQHSVQFRDGVRAREDWALRMLDSSSKLPSGLMSGNVMDMGHYDQCVGIEKIPTPTGPISGRYCLVHYGPDSWMTKFEVMARAIACVKEDESNFRKGHKSLNATALHKGLVWSICVPSSCRARDIELHLRLSLRKYVRSPDSLRIGEQSCTSLQDEQPITTSQAVFFAVMLLLVLLTTFATFCDLFSASSDRSLDTFRSFSLSFCVRRLFQSARAGPDALPVVDGVRVLGMLSIVLCHTCLISAFTPAVKLNHKFENNFHWTELGFFGEICVDVFLLLSGAMTCYSFLFQKEKGGFNVLHNYLHRYLRLTPTLGILVAASVTNVGIIFDKGPFVKDAFSTYEANCLNGWSSVIFYFSNFGPASKMCLTHTWSLSVDMQLFLLSPLILIPLYKWPKLGKVMLGLLILIGVFIAFWVIYSNDIQYVHRFPFGETIEKLYFQTHLRFTSWVLGIGLGYALHATKGSSLQLPDTVVTAGWILSVGLTSTALVSMYYFHHPNIQHSTLSTALFVSLHRPAWALGMAWIIFACSRGYGGRLNSFLSWSGFLVPSRLSYVAYLFHPIIVIRRYFNLRTPVYTTFSTVMEHFICNMLMTFLLSLVVHLLVEQPLNNLVKTLEDRVLSRPKQKQTSGTTTSSMSTKSSKKYE